MEERLSENIYTTLPMNQVVDPSKNTIKFKKNFESDY